MILTSEIIQSQIPEHIKSDSPLFVAFLEAYYRFADQTSEGHAQIQNIRRNTDIDLCDASYIDDFYRMYGDKLPRDIAMDRRNFIKILNSIYEASGTEKALKLAFQAVFNEEIKVTFPGENRLRASDGIWVREKYITLQTKFGAIPAGAIKLNFSNSKGDYSFETTRTEIIGNTARCYFQSFTNLEFDVNQRVFNYDSYGVMVYAGDLIPSPSYLSIRVPGRDWQVGQVFVIPGTITNTIARVTTIDSIGGVTGVEIVEYGSAHTEGQITTVSPYPNRPQTSDITVESTLISVDPPIYSHSLSIAEYISSMNESVVGFSDSFTVDSYFLEDYVESSYTGHTAFAQQRSSNDGGVSVDTGDLTFAEWLASRATFSYEYDDVVTLRGYYKNELGQLSNQAIKLQDNYFYQAFSYLIETSQDISKYESLLNITHPAGLKRFSDLTKASEIEISIEAERTLTVENI